jgi:hypothetical protein
MKKFWDMDFDGKERDSVFNNSIDAWFMDLHESLVEEHGAEKAHQIIRDMPYNESFELFMRWTIAQTRMLDGEILTDEASVQARMARRNMFRRISFG